MIELMRTNDLVIVSFVEAVLKEARIPIFVFDSNMSILEGSIGILPRRLMIDEDDAVQVRQLLRETHVTKYFSPEFRSKFVHI